MVDDVDERHWDRRPIRLLDSMTAAVWVRVGELATYLRHVLGMHLEHGASTVVTSGGSATRIRPEARTTLHLKAAAYRISGGGRGANLPR